MYKCEVKIAGENLEWDQGNEPSKQVKVGMPSVIKQKKSFQHKQVGLSQKFSVKNNVMDLSNRDITFFSIAATLLLPYMLGLMLTYFLFSFYGGMSLLSFLGIDKDYHSIQMWALGAYFFITAWVIWVVLRILTHKRYYSSHALPIRL